MPSTKVVVSSRLPGGHRRGGRLWPPSQMVAEVDEKLLAELQADAHLVVMVTGEASSPAQPPAPAPELAPTPAPAPVAPDRVKK